MIRRLNDVTDPISVALRTCESEPVHIPGRIQSFGALVALDPSTRQVRYASENAGPMLFDQPGSLLGEAFESRLDPSVRHALRGALGLPSIASHRERMGNQRIGDRPYDIAVHTEGDLAVIELEPLSSPDDAAEVSAAGVRSLLSRVDQGQGIERLLDSAVRALRGFTGFDRVMGYRFMPDGDGEVLAEARAPGLESFLGLRYPAYDIPPQVRRIALVMPFRVIADVRDPHVPVRGATPEPLNLTRTHLRGVSPIHCEYLRNMGVGASMNLSILVHGQLWGLFAFHHARKKRLAPGHRSVCELLGQLLSTEVQQEVDREVLQHRRRVLSISKALGAAPRTELSLALEQHAEDIERALDADGLTWLEGERVMQHGSVPPLATARALADLADLDSEAPLAFDRLPETHRFGPEQLGDVAGALVLPLHAATGLFLLVFRNETLQQVRWGGDPHKQLEHGPHGPRLHPRASFRAYEEQVTGRCNPWTQVEFEVAAELRGTLIEARFRHDNIGLEDRERDRRRRDLLISELNHRVKNILALIRSIAQQTRVSATSLEQYIEAFDKRILALSLAHDLVGHDRLPQAHLGPMLRAELRPYALPAGQLQLDGPPVALQSDMAPMISLTLHELVSNAVKHGALSTPAGRLSVRWRREAGGLVLHWRERGLSGLTPPSSTGFGLTLVRRAIPHECGGESSLTFHPDGLEARLWLPHEALASDQPDPPVGASAPAPAPTTATPRPQPAPASEPGPGELAGLGLVLVVENTIVLAMEMERTLAGFGCQQVICVSTAEEARRIVADGEVALAILDIRLASGTSLGLAEHLHALQVPFLFVSGYDAAHEIPEALRAAPRLTKPVDERRLSAAIQELLPP